MKGFIARDVKSVKSLESDQVVFKARPVKA